MSKKFIDLKLSAHWKAIILNLLKPNFKFFCGFFQQISREFTERSKEKLDMFKLVLIL